MPLDLFYYVNFMHVCILIFHFYLICVHSTELTCIKMKKWWPETQYEQHTQTAFSLSCARGKPENCSNGKLMIDTFIMWHKLFILWTQFHYQKICHTIYMVFSFDRRPLCCYLPFDSHVNTNVEFYFDFDIIPGIYLLHQILQIIDRTFFKDWSIFHFLISIEFLFPLVLSVSICGIFFLELSKCIISDILF